jgi:hypothetical protein
MPPRLAFLNFKRTAALGIAAALLLLVSGDQAQSPPGARRLAQTSAPSEKLSAKRYIELLKHNEENEALSEAIRFQNLASRLAIQMYTEDASTFCARSLPDLTELSTQCARFECDCHIAAAPLALGRCSGPGTAQPEPFMPPPCSWNQQEINQRLKQIDLEDGGVSGLYYRWLRAHGYLGSLRSH